jgi:hypothetical protein
MRDVGYTAIRSGGSGGRGGIRRALAHLLPAAELLGHGAGEVSAMACRKSTLSMTASSVALAIAAASAPVSARAQPAPPTEVGVAIYGWFPDIRGTTRFAQQTGGGDFTVDVGEILERLEFTFQGTIDVRRGRWGLLADVVYMSVGDSASAVRNASVGGVQLPVGASADVDLDMKSWIWTVAGTWRAVEQATHTIDVLAGVRYLDVEQTAGWTLGGNLGAIPLPGRAGTAKASLGNLDAIVGLRGRVALGAGSPWFVPYHLDLGSGESDFTWQAMAGLGYAFGRGEAVAAWRVLGYDFASKERIADLRFSGPMVGARFTW